MHAPAIAVPKRPPPKPIGCLPQGNQQHQSINSAAAAKRPPPQLRIHQPQQQLAIGEIAWPKMRAPRLPANGRKDVIPNWGFFVQKYLRMHYSHARTLAMQHITVQRVGLSMLKVNRVHTHTLIVQWPQERNTASGIVAATGSFCRDSCRAKVLPAFTLLTGSANT